MRALAAAALLCVCVHGETVVSTEPEHFEMHTTAYETDPPHPQCSNPLHILLQVSTWRPSRSTIRLGLLCKFSCDSKHPSTRSFKCIRPPTMTHRHGGVAMQAKASPDGAAVVKALKQATIKGGFFATALLGGGSIGASQGGITPWAKPGRSRKGVPKERVYVRADH